VIRHRQGQQLELRSKKSITWPRAANSPMRPADLRVEEHYTGTTGSIDHVFGLCPPAGFPWVVDASLEDKAIPIAAFSAEVPSQ
jgi:hypothetical protein